MIKSRFSAYGWFMHETFEFKYICIRETLTTTTTPTTIQSTAQCTFYCIASMFVSLCTRYVMALNPSLSYIFYSVVGRTVCDVELSDYLYALCRYALRTAQRIRYIWIVCATYTRDPLRCFVVQTSYNNGNVNVETTMTTTTRRWITIHKCSYGLYVQTKQEKNNEKKTHIKHVGSFHFVSFFPICLFI